MPYIASSEGFDPTFFEPLFDVEDKHFWFRTRNSIIATCVKRLVRGLTPGYQVLEVGCGTGNVLRVLTEACPTGIVVGMDLFAEGLRYARQRTTARLVQGDMRQPPFSNQFSLIGLFDTLEHLSDDRRALSDLRVMLQDGGVLLLTVPAHPRLWSYFDEASHHARRYRPNELREKLIDAGYRVEYSTQYMMSILPAMWLGRRVSSLRRRAPGAQDNLSTAQLAAQDLRPPAPVINALLTRLLEIEARWLAKGRTLPWGTSLLVIARLCR